MKKITVINHNTNYIMIFAMAMVTSDNIIITQSVIKHNLNATKRNYKINI